MTCCAWFQKVTVLPHGRSLEIPRGRLVGGGGVLKAKPLEEMLEPKLEFPGG